MALLLTQMAVLSVIGAVIGGAGAAIGLTATGDPLPGWEFVAAVGILTGLIAALVPDLVAARRDPLQELRAPWSTAFWDQ